MNETLLDVQTLSPYFEHMFGDKNSLREWFSLLLLHSEAATLAGPYFDFGTLAGAALDMIGASRSQRVTEVEKKKILDAIVRLPPHPEVKHALGILKNAGLRMVTLTSSSQKAVEQQVHNAGRMEFFEKNFSVDAINRYKPAPEAYRMVAAALGVETGQLRLVAAHDWEHSGRDAGWLLRGIYRAKGPGLVSTDTTAGCDWSRPQRRGRTNRTPRKGLAANYSCFTSSFNRVSWNEGGASEQ